MEKSKVKILILSISILILLAVIYASGNKKTSDDESGVSFAAIVKEYSVKGYEYAKSHINSFIESVKEKREEKRVENEAIQFLMHPKKVLEVKKQNDKESTHLIEESQETEDKQTPFVPFGEEKEIIVPNSLYIPETVGDTNFRSVRDYVYANTQARLYSAPDFSVDYGTATVWEPFLRVGISRDCCYQMVNSRGELVYADGTHFRRNREDMPLTEDVRFPAESYALDVKYISQFPTLPNGCEITSLATVLNYYGCDVDKSFLSDNFLPKEEIGSANFYEEFVGEPSSRNSYGCFAPAIEVAANSFLESINSELVARDVTGCRFDKLLEYVYSGIPVILWGAAYIDSEPGYSTEWIVDGEYLVWKTNMHCMVLTGFNEKSKTVTVSDPMRGIKEYDLDLFVKRFKQFYSQAVIVY